MWDNAYDPPSTMIYTNIFGSSKQPSTGVLITEACIDYNKGYA